jgi:60 kDa SS-A/Ro ribonucleoprotein
MSLVHHLIGSTTQFDRVAPGQVQNSDGAYVFPVDPFMRLERFLILGSSGGTYYASERTVTRNSAQAVDECLNTDALRAIKLIVDISQWGRAPKQSPGILALAIASAHPNPQVRALALPALPLVCRTASTMMEFLETVTKLRGWGSGLRRAIADWYTRLGPDELAYQTLKYRNRNGWSHRDILRKAHVPDGAWTAKSRALARWIVAGRAGLGERLVENRAGRRELQPGVGEPPALVDVFETIQALRNDAEGLTTLTWLITEHRLPHEMVPDTFKQHPEVWDALSQHMPLGALVRNLGKMSAVGLLTPGSRAAALVTTRISRLDLIRKSRLHPMAFLVAHSIYAQGKGDKGKLSWTPAAEISEALEQSFYTAFGNVQPTNQRLWLCLDVSDSMSWSDSAVPGMKASRASAALALVTLKTEPHARVMAFSHELVPFEINPDSRLEDVERRRKSIPYGATDCSLPFRHALQTSAEVDGFAVFTDSETNQNREHPFTALRRYRQHSTLMARSAVVAMVNNPFTIADPRDAGMLDVVGCDTHTPAILADFFRGKRLPRSHGED